MSLNSPCLGLVELLGRAEKWFFIRFWDMFHRCFKYSFCPFQLSLFLKYQLCLCCCVCVHGVPRMLRLLLLFYVLFCFSSDCIVSDDQLGGSLTASSSFPGMKVCSKWVDLSQFKERQIPWVKICKALPSQSKNEHLRMVPLWRCRPVPSRDWETVAFCCGYTLIGFKHDCRTE